MARAMINGFDDQRLNAMIGAADEWAQQIQDDEATRQQMYMQDRLDYASDPIRLRGDITLKPFQIEGVQWLLDKYIFKNSGCILGDEMGLGKTLQIVAYIAAVLRHWEEIDLDSKDCVHYTRPCFLILCPLSVMESWNEHLSKYCPDTISYIPYYGTNIKQRDEIQDQILAFRKMVVENFKAEPTVKNSINANAGPRHVSKTHPCVDIILTTYETLLIDKDFLTQFHYTNVIVDEAHRIKNPLTTQFGLLKRLPHPYLTPQKHTTLTRNSQFDYINVANPFLQQLFPPLSQRMALGNGNDMYAEQSLESNKKAVSKSAKQQNPYLIEQYMLSYDSAILLTGTLIQNNTLELWTLIHIVLPKFFPINSQSRYNRLFEMIGMHNFTLPTDPPRAVQHILSRLQFILAFCFLRRTKDSVDINLPPKTTYVLFSGMTSLQKRLYRSMLGKNCRDLLTCLNPQLASQVVQGMDDDDKKNSNSATNGKDAKKPRYQPGRKSINSSTALTNQPSTAQLTKSLKSLNSVWISLRKIINHSYLIAGVEPTPYQQGEHLVSASGKLILLDNILQRILPKGHRVLIFSISTELLDILQDFCEFRGYNTARLDGSIRGTDRGSVISDFQSQQNAKLPTPTQLSDPKKRTFAQLGKLDPVQPNQQSTPIFLLSTRAAGVGITLTAADTVIFYESDFNQAVDQQAEQRCYRIGQEKPVLSLRLICKGSIEHLYYLRNVRKAALSDAILQEGRFNPKRIQKKELKLAMKRNRQLMLSQQTTSTTHGMIDYGDGEDSGGDDDDDDDDDDDRSYVNIVVPDDVMKGDPDARPQNSEPERVTVTHTKANGSTYTSSRIKQGDDFQGDTGTMTAAVNLLMESQASTDRVSREDQELGLVDRNGNILDEPAYEKKHALLYSQDDLDWITYEGYSPNWDPVTRTMVKRPQNNGSAKSTTSAADGKFDFVDRDEQARRKRRIGGLADFMNAASVEQARKQKSMPVTSTAADGSVSLRIPAGADQDVVDEFMGREVKPTTSSLFDTTNIPTMRLAAFQDIVTTDMDRDEQKDIKKIKNALKSGQQIAQPQNPIMQQFLLELQQEVNLEENGFTGNDDNEFESGLFATNILPDDAKRDRKSMTQPDMRSLSSNPTPSSSTASSRTSTTAGSKRNSTGGTSRRSFKLDDSDSETSFNPSSSKPSSKLTPPTGPSAAAKAPQAAKPSPLQQAPSHSPPSRAQTDITDLLCHYQDLLDNLTAQYTKLKERSTRFQKKRYTSPIIYGNATLIMAVISHLRPCVIKLVIDHIAQFNQIEGLNDASWADFLQRNIPALTSDDADATTSQIVVPDYIQEALAAVNDEYTQKMANLDNPGSSTDKEGLLDELKTQYNSIFQVLHENLNSSIYLREAIYFTYHYTNLYAKCNFPIQMVVQKVITPLTGDVSQLILQRCGAIFDSLYQPSGQSNQFVDNQHIKFTDTTISIPLSQSLPPAQRNKFMLDIIQTIILVATENVLNEFSLLLNGTDTSTDSVESPNFYTFIPIQRLVEKQTPFPFLPLPHSTPHGEICTQSDLTRWIFSCFVVYNPEINEAQEYTPSESIKRPFLALSEKKKRKWRIDGESVRILEQALQYSIVYPLNNLTPPLQGFPRGIDVPGMVAVQQAVPASDLPHADPSNIFTSDDGQQMVVQTVLEYQFDNDRLINDIARLHHVSGNMLQPHLSLGCPRSALFEPLFSIDYNHFPQGPLSASNSTTTSRSTDSDDHVTMCAPFSPLSRANGFIILNFSDNSGKFGRGRLFDSIQALSPELAHHYSNAKEMRDLQLGSVVISPIPNPTTHNTSIPQTHQQLHLEQWNYIANVIVMKSEDRVPVLDKINEALDRVLLFAKLFNLVIIAPKQGFSTNNNDNSQYYTFEKLLTNKSSLYNVHCCIFHFSNTARQNVRPGTNSGANSSASQGGTAGNLRNVMNRTQSSHSSTSPNIAASASSTSRNNQQSSHQSSSSQRPQPTNHNTAVFDPFNFD